MNHDDAPVIVKCAQVVTAREVLDAETKLHGVLGPCSVLVAGEGMDLDLPLESGLPLELMQARDSPSTPGPLPAEVDGNVYASSTCTALQQVRAELMPKEKRQVTLQQQGMVWGDDELLFALHNLARQTDR